MARLACSLSISFFLILLVSVAEVSASTNIGSYQPAGAEGSVPLQECPAKCKFRCSATSHKKPCRFFCNYCCQMCLCVPSGTVGNKQECPCYNNMKTREGKPQVPLSQMCFA